MTTADTTANVIGTGLIGGSVGLALRDQGWTVHAVDTDETVAAKSVAIGAADHVGLNPDAALTVVATPVLSIPERVAEALAETNGVVTDVGSAKHGIATSISHPRFVPGHPMAGSEQDGIEGAQKDLFNGALWVLTPDSATDGESFAFLRTVLRGLGAEVVTMDPAVHDQVVALVSHVPHLTAAALMNLASDSAVEHRVLLRLAAGGFRDMTRISAGRPSIWPDICMANEAAICAGLDSLITRLSELRASVAGHQREDLLVRLEQARAARLNLPVGFGPTDNLTEIRIPIPDEQGQIARIAVLATELDVNIFDLEITHSAEGRQGVLIAIVDTEMAERFNGGLLAQGYRPSLRSLRKD